MALTQTLQVYKDCYELLKRLFPLIKEFPGWIKQTLGSRIIDTILSLMELILEINSTPIKERKELFGEARRKYLHLAMMCRLCCDEGSLNLTQYTAVSLAIGNIGKQLTGWQNAMREKEMKKEKKKE